MKNAQVINIGGSYPDSVLAFDGSTVIKDTAPNEQEPISTLIPAVTAIQVDIDLYDLMDGSHILVEDVTMDYDSIVDYWTVSIADVEADLMDRHKYVGVVSEHGSSVGMRKFKIEEFCVDNESLEEVWMSLPYQVEIGTESFIRWYEKDDSDFSGDPLFEAPAYQGGVGTDYATSPSSVTHRGAVTRILATP